MHPLDTPFWRRRKLSRSEWREGHQGRKKIPHGGRGKKYGLKSHRKKKRRKAA